MRAPRSVREILLTSAPIALAVFVFAVSFGVLAITARIPGWAAVLMSALVFAGSAQFAALGLLTGGWGWRRHSRRCFRRRPGRCCRPGMPCAARLAERWSPSCWRRLRRRASLSRGRPSWGYGWLVSPRAGAGPGRSLVHHARDRAVCAQPAGGHHATDKRTRARVARRAGGDPAHRGKWAPPYRRESGRRHPGGGAVSPAGPADRLRCRGRPCGRAAPRGLSPVGAGAVSLCD